MLIDILSGSNEQTYNSQLANLLGLKTAIYLSQVFKQYQKAHTSNKTIGNSFIIDSKEISLLTTLTIKEQDEILASLCIKNIIGNDTVNSGYIFINIDNIFKLFDPSYSSSRDLDCIKASKKETIGLTKGEKKQLVFKEIAYSAIRCTNEELRNAYVEWIDCVFEKVGYLSKVAVEEGQKLVDNYSNHDLDKALCVLKKAAVNGYKDISWAIKQVEKTKEIAYNTNKNMYRPGVITNTSELSQEVF